MSSKTSDSTKRNREEASSVSDLLIESIAPRLNEDPDSEIFIRADVDGVSIESQLAGMMAASVVLNDRFDCGLWVNPYILTNDPELVVEKEDVSLERVRENFFQPEELDEMSPDGIGGEVDEFVNTSSADTEELVEKLQNLKNVLDHSVVETYGLDTKEEKKEFFDKVLELIKPITKQVSSNQVNVVYGTYEESGFDEDQKQLFAQIGAYVLGHMGCRVGVQDGEVVFVDDVRMYAERHDFLPEEFVKNSWSQKEAELELTGDR